MSENVKTHYGVDYKYDFTNDILLFKSNKDFEYNETIEMSNEVLLDFDVNNEPVSLEILDASKILGVPKDSLRNLVSFKMHVTVTGKVINLKVKICVLVRNKRNNQNLEKITSNDYNIPAMDTELVVA